ncbi:hypothetical protein OAA47_02965 [Methylophilaceae bacterium]|nr:hypothetical protein [Methylophilaceae bacterium]
MLKCLVCSIFFMLCSCHAFTSPQEQPVIQLEDNVYKTTCSGTVENWGQCFIKAKRTCQEGYTNIEKLADSSGVHRSFSFSCK